MCINYTHLYRTPYKTPIKKEKKRTFFNKKKSNYKWSKAGEYIKKN